MHESPERARRGGPKPPLFDRPGPRRARFALIVVGVVLAVGAVLWVVATGLLAHSQLNKVRADLPRLRAALSAADVPAAQAISDDIDNHARKAHALTTGPAWWAGASIPVLGDPLTTTRVIAKQVSRISASVLPGVVTLTKDLSTGKLQTADGIDLAPLIAAEPTLDRAAATANSADEAIRSAPKSWLGAIESAHQSLAADVTRLHDQIAGASRAIHTAVPMLGADGTRRYFIAFENEAESRGLGGVPGSFAIVEVSGGHMTFSHYGSDLELLKTHVALDLGTDFRARYQAADPTYSYPNSDISPDFSYAARIWAAMWQSKSGQHIDGAAVVDPSALAALLRVSGPTYLPNGMEINGGNVVMISEQTQYSMFRKDDAANHRRRAFLTSMATAITEKLIHSGDAKSLVRALSKQAALRRFAVWSSDPTLEANIVAGGYGGLLPPADGRPVTGFVLVNATGGKLDYYLHRSMTYQRSGCTGVSSAVATFTVNNTAPASGLPPYVTQRRDRAPVGVKPGDDRVLLTYYAGHGAVVHSITLDGKDVSFVSGSEKGLVTASVDLELPRGRTREVSVAVTEQPAVSSVFVLDQPAAVPTTVTLSGSNCGS